MKDLRAEPLALKEVVADLILENRILKNTRAGPLGDAEHHLPGNSWGRPRMRYPASETLEIIRIVEHSHIPVRRTPAQIGIPPTTFYRPSRGLRANRCRATGYDRYVEHGPEGLEDQPPSSSTTTIADIKKASAI